MGTSGFAVPILHALFNHFFLAAVVTQPDRPKGRGRRLAVSAVKEKALNLGIPVLQPEGVRNPAFIEELRNLKPRLAVVAAYGQILPGELLEIPEMGCVNVHASLLPRYRGAAPMNHAIINGESRTGVTVIQMDEGMDTGPLLLSREAQIEPEDTVASLQVRLATIGAGVIVETIRGLESGEIKPIPQDESLATYAPLLKKEDGRIDWTQSAAALERRIRGLQPWPGSFTRLEGRVLKVFSGRVDRTQQSQPPGCIVEVKGEGIRVATGDGHLILDEIQLEGKRRLPVREFVMGCRVVPGTILE
jgi:methionyl-tRNA formyltransferase